MTIKKNVYIAIAIVFFISGPLGCAPMDQYGKVATGAWGGQSMTIKQLYENWEDYHVYYSGVHKYFLGAIMFDPKSDEKRIVGHAWWTEVKDQELLSELLVWISFWHFPPDLMRIQSPDNQFYGYIYTLRSDAHIKKIDDKTLWIDQMVEPMDVVEIEWEKM